MDKSTKAAIEPAAVADDLIVVVVREETESVYWVPRQRFLDLELPNSPRAEGEPFDDEQTMAAIEGIEPIEFAVQERQLSFPTDA